MNTRLVKVSRRRPVRCRIRAGGIGTRLEHGRYFIYGQKSVQSGDKTPTQNGHVDTRIGQANNRMASQVPQADSPERNDRESGDVPTSHFSLDRARIIRYNPSIAFGTGVHGCHARQPPVSAFEPGSKAISNSPI